MRGLRKLGRTASHRHATLDNMVSSLIIHKEIKTTDEKAKEASVLFDRLVTYAKKNDVAARREALRHLRNRDLVKALFEDIGPSFSERNGGYTRIVKLGQRKGDGAFTSLLSIVGFEKFITETAAVTE